MLRFIICLTIGGKSDGIFDRYFMHLLIFRNRISSWRNSFISDLRGVGWQEKTQRLYQKLVTLDGVEKE